MCQYSLSKKKNQTLLFAELWETSTFVKGVMAFTSHNCPSMLNNNVCHLYSTNQRIAGLYVAHHDVAKG